MKKRTSKIMAALTAAVMALSALPVMAAEEEAEVNINVPIKSGKNLTYTYDGVEYTDTSYAKYAASSGTSSKVYRLYTLSNSNTTDISKFDKQKGVEIEYEFEVAESGVYQLEMSSSHTGVNGLGYYSVAVDEGHFQAISSTTSAGTENNTEYSAGNTYHAKQYIMDYVTPYKYYLDAGTHSFKVKLHTESRAEVSTLECRIHNINFKKTSDTAADDIYITGISSYSTQNTGLTVAPPTASDWSVAFRNGSCVAIDTESGFEEGGYIISYPFTVAQAGYYNVADVVANKIGNKNYSQLAISVDNGDFVKLGDMHNGESTAIVTGYVESADVYKRYALSEGQHTLNIHVYEAVASGENKGNTLAYFDHIKLTRDADAPVKIYGTDGYDSNISELSESGYDKTELQYLNSSLNPVDNYPDTKGKVVTIVGPAAVDETALAVPESGITLDYPLYVNETGWYSLDLTMYDIGKNGSPVSVSIDGIDESIFANGDQTNIINTTEYDTHRSTLDTRVLYYLTEGMHTFTYKITDIAINRNRVYSALVSAEFTPESSIDLCMVNRLEKDESTWVCSLVKDDYTQTTYTSSNPEVARITKVGKIIAAASGKTTITATVTLADGEKISYSEDIYVTVDGISAQVESVNVDTEASTVTANVGAYIGQPVVILAAYEGDALKKVDVAQAVEGEGAQAKLEEITVTDNTQISVMIWDTMSSMKPVAGKYIYNEAE